MGNEVYVDHLNTPRLIANQTGQTVWRWDQAEPFGVNVPDENPLGLGAFEFPLRFPGQYDRAALQGQSKQRLRIDQRPVSTSTVPPAIEARSQDTNGEPQTSMRRRPGSGSSSR